MVPSLSLSPESPLLDETLTICGTGFEPGERVTLVAEFEVLWGQFRAEATFEADETGRIDLTEQAPVAGDYEGVRPMGLVQFAELVERADDAPGEIADSHRFRVWAQRDGERLAEQSVLRRTLDSQVDCITVDNEHDELVGDLYLPPGDGPHPGVVVLGGSGGGVPAIPRAKLLASHGYAVLALAYFQSAARTETDRDDEHIPEELIEVPIEYGEHAVEWVRSHERVQSEPVGVVGISVGSELAYLLGARVDSVRTVVGYVPSGVLFEGISFSGNSGPAWVADSDPLPHVDYRFKRRYYLAALWHMLRGKPVPIEIIYRGGLADADADTVKAATIPVEDIDGPVLSLAGGDDKMWPSDALGRRAIDRLEAREYEHYHEHVVYTDTGHNVTAPYLPVTARTAIPVFPRCSLATGGTPEGYAKADVDSWQRVLDTLDRGLR